MLADEYLNSEQLLDHALHMVLKSILFKFHSQRMIDLLLRQVRSVRHALLLPTAALRASPADVLSPSPSLSLQREATPCENYVVMSALLCYGHHTPGLYRGLGKWRPVLQRLLNPLRPPDQRVGDIEGEVRLRVPVSSLLYEICRVQKLEDRDLGQCPFARAVRAAARARASPLTAARPPPRPDADLFDEDLIDNLFEMIETTRGHEDETLNYSLIKLLVRHLPPPCCGRLSPAAADALSSTVLPDRSRSTSSSWSPP